ncbi:YbbR-like domain-containing protein [Aequorivita sp. H23M31]|uniref:YbbR-like domain-containing protein n=1 Tax=Aequorivita ciconiae TaxID=2494375 RepID=A0A410FZE5_9FLAO|nr:CdaR family protein [Aequorivita sp. H23M31]QAA80397.1 YbbR-like domain-containing protein [Aequorivita sp. H23M31]
MAKNTSRKYSKRKVKLFLFFLLVASIFWVLTKFSREFTASMVAKIHYINLPDTAALAHNNPQGITYDLTANGFEILFYKFKKPALEVDVAKYYEEDENGFTISRNELGSQLGAKFNKYMEIKNLPADGIKIKLDPIVLKKVKVEPKFEIGFKDGFKPIDSIKVKPDSITISGPEGVLKKISGVPTNLLSLKDVDRSISETVEINPPTQEIVKINPSKVLIEWPVAEFSQGKFTLPVEVINLPPGVELKLVPERVTVTFDISVNQFSSVSRENFRVICDYSKRNDKENFMLPILAKKPEGAVNIVFDPKKVDFFVFK